MSTFQLAAWTLDNFSAGNAEQLVIYPPYAPTLTGAPLDENGYWYQANSYDASLDGEGGIYCTQEQTLTSILATIWTPTVPSAKQFASCGVRAVTIPGGGGSYAGVSVRFNPSGGGSNPECYALLYDSSVPGWKLIKQRAGAQTVLATYSGAGQSILAGATGSCALLANGSTLTATTNGVTHAPVTDAQITAAGFLGIFLGTHGGATPDTGLHVQDYLGAYLPA